MPPRFPSHLFQRIPHSVRTSAQVITYFSFFSLWTVVIASKLPSTILPQTVKINGMSMAPVLSPDFRETGVPWKLHLTPKDECDLFPDEVVSKNEQASLLGRMDAERKKTGLLKLCRGHIIAYRSPDNPEREAVKRVIALAGDVVIPRRAHWPEWQKASRNGGMPSLQIEVDIKPRTPATADTPSGCSWPRRGPVDSNAERRMRQAMRGDDADEIEEVRVTVPYGHAWVEGENAKDSLDSNTYGPISKRLITGIARAIYTPKELRGPVEWENDGWEQRWKGRVHWKYIDGIVPDEWAMHT